MSAMFGDAGVEPTLLPSRLATKTILLKGHELRVVPVGQGDIAPSTVLHIPELGVVISGDVTYNRIHQMLGLGGPAEWAKWIESIDRIEALSPRMVVSGHKKPSASDHDVKAILGGSRRYIVDFREALRRATSASDLINEMRSKYPEHGNLTTLVFSASAAFKAAFE